MEAALANPRPTCIPPGHPAVVAELIMGPAHERSPNPRVKR
jgi:hypothetical protein